MPKKAKRKSRNLWVLLKRALDSDAEFYDHLWQARERIISARIELSELIEKKASKVRIKKARQKEARLVNGLILRVRGKSPKLLKAVQSAFDDLTLAAYSNRWEYPWR